MSARSLTKEQSTLVAELVQRFGIEPDEVVFFGDDPKPLLAYEATCVIANTLVPDLAGIVIEPVQSVSPDAVSLLCSLKFKNGNLRNAIGVANSNEPLDGGEAMTDQQVYQLASGRAMRAALRVAGIDLIKLHRGDVSIEAVSHRQNLLRQVHALGEEIGYISGGDKQLWRSFLRNIYDADSASTLSDIQLADFAARLQLIRKPYAKAA